jgi:hypothetical protein
MELLQEGITNQIAAYERSITGVKHSFDFAKNPDVIQPAMLPCVLHYMPSFDNEPLAHFNVWRADWVYRSILFVKPQTAQGGALKFLENEAIPFGHLWLQKFTEENVIRTLFTTGGGGTVRAYLENGQYGAGGPLLTFADIPYIGWIFSFGFRKGQ